MGAQITTRRPVQLPTRSIVLFIIVLAVVVTVAASWWLGATTSTTPTGVQQAEPAPAAGPMAAAFSRIAP